MTGKISKIWMAYLLLVTLSLTAVAGCTSAPAERAAGGTAEQNSVPGDNADASKQKNGGTITVAMAEEPESLDAHNTVSVAGEFIGEYLGASLLYSDPNTQEVKPYLVETYTTSNDGKTWTFTLRSGITFHDGTPLTAQMYKATFERALSPEFAQKAAGAGLALIESISAPDDRTLVLKLKEPSASLLTTLCFAGATQPLSPDAVKKFGKQYGRNPVGVGPWKFESWKTGESITLVRNEAFQWADSSAKNQGPVRPDKLVLKFIPSSQTMLAALDSGTIDIATNVPAKAVKKYRDNDKYTVFEQLRNGLGFYIELNMRQSIFQDINLRKALNMAVNKKAIIQAALQGEGVIAHGPLPESVFGYDPAVADYAYPYNPEAARQLLEASGWKLNGQGIREKDGKPLRLQLMSLERYSQEAQLVQGMLKEIGVEVSIEMLEAGALLEKAAKGDFEMTVMGSIEQDPDALYDDMHSSQIGGMNDSGIDNKQLDRLLEAGRSTLDMEQRKKVYADVQRLAVQEAYWIPIYIEKKFTVVNNRVQGVKQHPVGQLLFQDSWVNQK